MAYHRRRNDPQADDRLTGTLLLSGCLFAAGLFGLPGAGRTASQEPAQAPAQAAGPQAASSPATIGFATAEQRKRWRLKGDGYDIGFDTEDVRAGAPSLRLALRAGAVYREGGFAVASTHLTVDQARGRHLRLEGWIKSSAIGRGWAGLWVRVEGAHGVLAFDNMGDRGVHGTTGWSRVEVELDVPPETAAITLGALLAGDGTAWVSDLAVSLEPLSQVVEGKVVDPLGRPVSGALVAAVAGDADEPAAVVRSGLNGRFRAVVPAGRVTLTATASGFAPAFQILVETRADAPQGLTCQLRQGGLQLRGELKPAAGLPPAGTRVALARFKDEGGGWFYSELDGDGRFMARLPPGSYRVTLDSDSYVLSPGVVSFGGEELEQRVTFTASRLMPVPEEVVSWLRLHVVPLRTTAPGQGFEDLRPLASIVGQARIVALGEATHGMREFFQLKHRVLEFLVSEMGFTVLAMEANGPESRAIDDYVLHGKGNAVQALGGLFFVWNTDEVLDMIEWMRAFNADPTHARKVRFFGFDMQSASVARRFVAAYLDKVDVRYAKKMARRLAAFPDDPHAQAGAASASALATARALVGQLDTHQAAYVASSSRQEWELVRQDATVLEQSAELAVSQQPDDRDRAMATNVGWILAHQPPGTRMVLWGHNAHVNYGKDRGSYTPMGEFLRRQLGSGYMNIGFLFDQGSFQAIRPAGQELLGLHEFTVGPSPIDSLAAAFHRTGVPLALIDLRSCPRSGPVAAWLTSPHAVREAGASFFGKMWMLPAAITDRFDALLYVDRTTRSRPVVAGAR
jgi:erythromycin esterase